MVRLTRRINRRGGDTIRTIQVGANRVALVDDEDYEYVNRYKWYTRRSHRSHTYYAFRLLGDTGRTESMHHYITGFAMTDHKDRNGLNNQKENLRECNHSQNMGNVVKHRGTHSSTYKGVSWTTGKRRKRWKAAIAGQAIGYYDNEIEAARAYDVAAIAYYREFACLNFPDGLMQ